MLHDSRKLTPIVVTGPAGCGKSATVADVVRLHRIRHPGALIFHASADLATGVIFEQTLRDLCCSVGVISSMNEKKEMEKGKGGVGWVEETFTRLSPLDFHLILVRR